MSDRVFFDDDSCSTQDKIAGIISSKKSRKSFIRDSDIIRSVRVSKRTNYCVLVAFAVLTLGLSLSAFVISGIALQKSRILLEELKSSHRSDDITRHKQMKKPIASWLSRKMLLSKLQQSKRKETMATMGDKTAKLPGINESKNSDMAASYKETELSTQHPQKHSDNVKAVKRKGNNGGKSGFSPAKKSGHSAHAKKGGSSKAKTSTKKTYHETIFARRYKREVLESPLNSRSKRGNNVSRENLQVKAKTVDSFTNLKKETFLKEAKSSREENYDRNDLKSCRLEVATHQENYVEDIHETRVEVPIKLPEKVYCHNRFWKHIRSHDHMLIYYLRGDGFQIPYRERCARAFSDLFSVGSCTTSRNAGF